MANETRDSAQKADHEAVSAPPPWRSASSAAELPHESSVNSWPRVSPPA